MDRSDSPSSSASHGSLLVRLAIFGVAYLSIGLLTLVSVFPWQPSTRAGWMIYLLLATPVCVAGEWLSERLARPWWESSLPGKTAKAVLLTLVALVALVIVAIVRA